MDPLYYLRMAQQNQPPFVKGDILPAILDFCSALKDPTVKIIWLLHGLGYGGETDFVIISTWEKEVRKCLEGFSPPPERKILIGFCGVTPLLAMLAKARITISIHGPMASNLRPENHESTARVKTLLNTLQISTTPVVSFSCQAGNNAANRAQSGHGQLFGGVFELILGDLREGLISLNDTILFVEFIPYGDVIAALDELIQAFQNGTFHIFGLCVGYVDPTLQNNPNFQRRVTYVLDILDFLKIPAWIGMPFGHNTAQNFPWIYGHADYHYENGLIQFTYTDFSPNLGPIVSNPV